MVHTNEAVSLLINIKPRQHSAENATVKRILFRLPRSALRLGSLRQQSLSAGEILRKLFVIRLLMI